METEARPEKGPYPSDTCQVGTTYEPRTIGWAIKQLWNGCRVFRKDWNGKGMYLALQIPDRGSKMGQPYVYIRTPANNYVPWVCSQSDLLASDWETFK